MAMQCGYEITACASDADPRPLVQPLAIAPELCGDDVRAAASFVASWCHRRSPGNEGNRQTATETLRASSGSAADIAVLLVSLLLGAGFDAYVCDGFVAAYVASGDTMRLVRVPQPSSVQWETGCVQAWSLAVLTFAHSTLARYDDTETMAAHSWVLVRAGRCGVTSAVFIDACTGAVVAVGSTASPFHTVTRLYNNCDIIVACVKGGVDVTLSSVSDASSESMRAAETAAAVAAAVHFSLAFPRDAASPYISITALDKLRVARCAGADKQLLPSPEAQCELHNKPGTYTGPHRGALPDVDTAIGIMTTSHTPASVSATQQCTDGPSKDADGVPRGAPRFSSSALMLLCAASNDSSMSVATAGPSALEIAHDGAVHAEVDGFFLDDVSLRNVVCALFCFEKSTIDNVVPVWSITRPSLSLTSDLSGTEVENEKLTRGELRRLVAARCSSQRRPIDDALISSVTSHGRSSKNASPPCATDTATPLTEHAFLGPDGLDSVLPPRVIDVHRCKLELFPPRYVDGICLRVTVYSDDARILVEYVEEYFSHRADCLVHRMRLPASGSVEDLFVRGRQDALQKSISVPSMTQRLTFFSGARVDGLVRRSIDVGRKIWEEYDDAADNKAEILFYRSVTFASVAGGVSDKRHAATHAASLASCGGIQSGASRQLTEAKRWRGVAADTATVTRAWAPEWVLGACVGGHGGVHREQTLIKMTEKFRPRNTIVGLPVLRSLAGSTGRPALTATPLSVVEKVVYNLAAHRIVVHTSPQPLCADRRQYQKSAGSLRDGATRERGVAPPPAVAYSFTASGGAVLAPFAADVEFRALLRSERECFTAIRRRGKELAEMEALRKSEDSVDAGQNQFTDPEPWEVANARTIAGHVACIDEDAAMTQTTGGWDMQKSTLPASRHLTANHYPTPTVMTMAQTHTSTLDPCAGAKDIDDILGPFLVASSSCASHPTEAEARKAEKDCRAAYKTRLLERGRIIQHRLTHERGQLRERQLHFSERRSHAPQVAPQVAVGDDLNSEGLENTQTDATAMLANEAEVAFLAAAALRISVAESRLRREEVLLHAQLAALDDQLFRDPRLRCLRKPDDLLQLASSIGELTAPQ